jgi:hypothetical protein
VPFSHAALCAALSARQPSATLTFLHAIVAIVAIVVIVVIVAIVKPGCLPGDRILETSTAAQPDERGPCG